MNKRGVLILSIAIAAAIGAGWWLKSSRDKAPPAQSATTSSAQLQTASKPAVRPRKTLQRSLGVRATRSDTLARE